MQYKEALKNKASLSFFLCYKRWKKHALWQLAKKLVAKTSRRQDVYNQTGQLSCDFLWRGKEMRKCTLRYEKNTKSVASRYRDSKPAIKYAEAHAVYAIPVCKTRTNNILNLPALKQSVYMMLDTPTHHYWQTRASIFKKSQDGSDMHKLKWTGIPIHISIHEKKKKPSAF